MNKNVVLVVIAAAVVFAGSLVAAVLLTGNSSKGGGTHTMQNGQVMTAPMHTMSDASTMTGMTMP